MLIRFGLFEGFHDMPLLCGVITYVVIGPDCFLVAKVTGGCTSDDHAVSVKLHVPSYVLGVVDVLDDVEARCKDGRTRPLGDPAWSREYMPDDRSC